MRYVADIYFRDDDLSRFDLVVIVKNFNWLRPDALRRLRARGTWLLYDTADIRYVRTAEGLRDLYVDRDVYESHFRPFVHSMDALILASPLQRPEFADLSIPQVEIPRPLLNTRHRTAYAHGGPIRLVWHGYLENLPPMQQLHPIVQRLRADTSLDIRLVYDTAGRPRVDGFIEYREWKIERWERVLVESDIGVVIKPLEDPFQQRKPPDQGRHLHGRGAPRRARRRRLIAASSLTARPASSPATIASGRTACGRW
ncbi:MAG TPA: hypothetical protein VL948_04095 [Verrucomicrobiae bacterium]|nr:hypothetical protein [Verrucomicrobiae bacterium]